jgi:hypothetical protein
MIHDSHQKQDKDAAPWPQIAAASIRRYPSKDHAYFIAFQVDARISVQNTLYLVFGA